MLLSEVAHSATETNRNFPSVDNLVKQKGAQMCCEVPSANEIAIIAGRLVLNSN